MRIKVIHAMTGATPEFVTHEEEVFRQYARPDTEISIEKIEQGSQSIESHFDEYLGSIDTFRIVKRAEKEGFDGVIITCFANANVEPSREIAGIPVIGSGMATMILASLLGHRFAMIMAKESSLYRHRHEAYKLGVESKLAAFRRTDFSVLGLIKDLEKTKASFIKAARQAIDEDGVDVVIPGCFGMVGLADQVREELGVPVIDPAGAAITVMESLVTLGLTHSKVGYPFPPPKRRDYKTGYGDVRQ